MGSNLSVVILTFNEEIHIKRCIESLLPIAKNIFIVDSYSNDKTVEICESLGAKIY
jgi:glycosyltransferase involved in cell wall biosynthesis